MTREQAISVLECMAVDLTGCMGGLSKKDPLEDVCRQRLEAINTAQSALSPITQEQVEKVWRAHWNESTHLGGFVYCSRCGYNALEANNYTFCPKCGSPFTDEAVEMVMERLEELKDVGTDY